MIVTNAEIKTLIRTHVWAIGTRSGRVGEEVSIRKLNARVEELIAELKVRGIEFKA